ncbi:MAG: trigger factor [Planctomycetota bacterium]|nr:trigger factor [Planctomycetota bacterium]
MAADHAADTADSLPNHVVVTDSGPCTKRITITIPAATVAGKVKDSLDALLVEAQLPGFRKGHAPRRLVEKRFGAGVRNEAKNQLVAEAYSKAMEDLKLKVLGEPASPGLKDLEIKDGEPLTVELDVEVVPDFQLPATEGIPVRKPQFSVTNELVEGEVQKIRVNEGSLESRDLPEPGDYLTGHAVMTSPSGEEFYNIKGAVVQVPAPEKQGKGMVLGVIVDDFSTQLGLPKVGETATIRVRGPENHEVEKLRGVDLTVTFAVERIDRIIPASLESLAQRLGFQDNEAFKEFVRQRLEQRVRIEQQSVMRQQLAEHLLTNVQMELPRRATAAQAARLLERRRMELMYRGVPEHQIEEHMAELRRSSDDAAVRELKLFFILNTVAEQMAIRVDDAEINARIVQMARESGERPEKLRQAIIQRNQVGVIYQQIREHKAMDAILSNAAVTEVPAEEFNAIMQAEAEKKQPQPA